VLEYLIAYAEHQFGDRVEGISYRERKNNDRMDNWDVELVILLSIYSNITSAYARDDSLSIIARDDLIFPYLEKQLDLLRPWSAYVDLDSTSLRGSLSGDQINHILMALSDTERQIASSYSHRNEFDLAANYSQQALSHARLYEGEEEVKTDLLCTALSVYCELQLKQGKYADAVALAEEAYNCVAVVYNPVHPEVQKAAGNLIECLTHKGDFYDAERFAQATLDSLKDPGNEVDQQSEEVATGYFNLAHVINGQQQGDLVKAEMLVRESLRIRARIFHNDDSHVGMSTGLLANILHSQGNLCNETKELYERSLAIDIKNEGLEGVNTAAANGRLGIFYHQLAKSQQNGKTRKEHLLLSRSKCKEALRIYTKIFGPDDPRTIIASSDLSMISRELSEA
jgi:tetratricopeptide (TPR) repeat protein